MIGYPMLKGVGKWLGSGIGSILGSGDYQVMGAHPNYNLLTSDAQIPKFSAGRQTNIVCHREYLQDISGTAAFTLQQFPINPGIGKTFPWLSSLAQNYQEYRIHGMIVEFRSLITDFVTGGAPGTVVIATNYNADAPLFSSKQEMENSEYAVATKPTLNLIHGIECAGNQTVLPEKYVRTGNVPAGQDLRLYDLGNIQVATQGNPTQLLGELWVSYCVEFFKPILPVTTGGDVAGLDYLGRAVGPSAPFGLVPGPPATGNLSFRLAITVPTSTFFWSAQPGNIYLVIITWTSTTSVAMTVPALTLTSGQTLTSMFAGPSSVQATPAGTVGTSCSIYFATTCILGAPGEIGFNLPNSASVFGPTTEVTVVVTTLDSSMKYPV
jgi:hypothetical protein